MDGRVWVGGGRGRSTAAAGAGRWPSQGFPRPACSQARAARGPGSDRGAARFARNFVVMAPVGPLILSRPRERGCWRSSGWSSGKESASRVPIRHVRQGLRAQNRQGWLCLWLCRGPGAPLLSREQWGPHQRGLRRPLTCWLVLATGCWLAGWLAGGCRACTLYIIRMPGLTWRTLGLCLVLDRHHTRPQTYTHTQHTTSLGYGRIDPSEAMCARPRLGLASRENPATADWKMQVVMGTKKEPTALVVPQRPQAQAPGSGSRASGPAITGPRGSQTSWAGRARTS